MALAVGSTEMPSPGPAGASPTARPREDDPVAGAGVGGRRGVPAVSGRSGSAAVSAAGALSSVSVSASWSMVVESARSSSSGGSTGGSKGPLRLRCASTRGATRRRSSTSVLSRPSRDAYADAARLSTRSARSPSAPTCNASRDAVSSTSSVSAAPAAGQCGEVRDDRSRNLAGLIELEPAANGFDAIFHRRRRAYLDTQPEAIEQLRSQLALFGIHRSDENEPARMTV